MDKRSRIVLLGALIWLSQEVIYPEVLNDFLDAQDVMTSVVQLVTF